MLGTISTAYNVSSYGINASDPLSADLYAYWKFNGDALDASGNVDLTAVNSPTYTTGLVFTQAASLDSASTQYFRNQAVAISPVTVASSGIFTIQAWIKWATFAAFEYVFIGGTSTSATLNWCWLRKDNTTNKFTGSISNGTSGTNVTSTNAATTGTWMSIFFWHEGDGKARLQLNADTADASSGTMTGTLNEADDVTVGADVNGLNNMNAIIGPVAYWAGRALTATERATYYNSGSGRPIF